MKTEMDSKLLPQRIEAERHVLGCCMKFDDALYAALEARLEPGDFFKPLHRQIFRALVEIDSDGETKLNQSSIIDALKRSPEGLSDADFGYVLELRDDAVTTAGLDSSLELVQDAAMLRKIIEESQQIISRSLAYKEKPRQILEEAENRFYNLAQRRLTQDYHSLQDLVYDAIQEIEDLKDRSKDTRAIFTDFYELDELLTGLHPSNLIILASRPGMGKTALGLNIAQQAALRHNVAVGFFSLEMSATELIRRMLCSEARIDSQKVRKGLVSREEIGEFKKVVTRLAATKFFIDDTSALTVTELRAKARRLVMQQEVRLIVVDYLQLMTAPSRRMESRQVEVSEISRSLKQLAMELQVPVLAMAQLNRGVTSRAVKSKIPQLSDLRESGAIEQDADVVLFIHRDDYYKVGEEGGRFGPNDYQSGGEGYEEPHEDYGAPDQEGVTKIIVAKQRNGPVGDLKLLFLKKYMRFENLSPTYTPRSVPAGAPSRARGDEEPF